MVILQGRNITLPEHLRLFHFDCGHVDFRWTGPAGMYFLLSFSTYEKFHQPHTHISELSAYSLYSDIAMNSLLQQSTDISI